MVVVFQRKEKNNGYFNKSKYFKKAKTGKANLNNSYKKDGW